MPKTSPQQDFVARFTDLNDKELQYGEGKFELRESLVKWEVTGGRIIGPTEGTRQVRWDLTGVGPGNYELRALYPKYKLKNRKLVRNGDYVITFLLPIRACSDCEADIVAPQCPDAVSVENADSVDEGTEASFTARVVNPPSGSNITYSWSVSPGRIVGSNDTQTITVDTTGLGSQTVRATVQLGGLDPRCATTAKGNLTVARGETGVKVRSECKLFDSYGAIKYNDEKARLDNLAIQLREPGIEAYIVTYRGFTHPRIGNLGTSKLRVVGDVCGEYRYKRALDYLVNDRGVEEARIKHIDGGSLAESSVELWICPSNKTPSPTQGTGVTGPGPCINRGVPAKARRRSMRHAIRRR